MKYLGIDYGSKRVGIAVSDDEGNIAFPKVVIDNDSALLEYITKVIENENITLVVVGESRDLEGKENPIMFEITHFIEQLKEKVSTPIHLEPEFLTTAEARRQPLSSDEPRSRKKQKHKKTDASAAALILQSYINKVKNK